MILDYRITFLLSLVLIGLYCFFIAPYFWGGSDDGQLGHSVERIISGERPFINFDEPYTGGLAYFHAFIFSYFGESLLYLRYSLLFCILITIWPVFSIFKNYFSPIQSFILTSLVFLLTFPSYFNAIPSWYMSLITIWVIYLSHSYIKNHRLILIVMSGILIGIATLLKINGIFILAANIFFILNFNISKITTNIDTEDNKLNLLSIFFIFGVILALIIFNFLLTSKIKISMNTTSVLLFLLPCYFLSFYTTINLTNKHSELNIKVISHLLLQISALIIPFLLITATYFLSIYKFSEFPLLIDGLFLAPERRITLYNSHPPPIILYLLLGGAFLLIKRLYIISSPVRYFNVINTIFLTTISILSLFAIGIIYSFYLSVTFIGLLFIFHLLIFSKDPDPVSLMVATYYCLFSLIQFPFFNLVYMIYPFPLMLIFIFIRKSKSINSLFKYKYIGVITLLCLLFGSTGILTRNDFHILNISKAIFSGEMQRLNLRDSNLWFSKKEVQDITELTNIIHQDFPNKKILVTPDAPDVYYFAKIKNHTPIFYDQLSIPNTKERHSYFQSLNFDVIIVNCASYSYNFEGANFFQIYGYLKSKYKHHKTIGRFQIFTSIQ